MLKKIKNRTKFDTSKEAWEKIGIYLTDEQYEDLCAINMFMQTQENPIPVHHIMLVLKTLGLLKPKVNQSNSPQYDNDNGDNNTYYLIQSKFGDIKK